MKIIAIHKTPEITAIKGIKNQNETLDLINRAFPMQPADHSAHPEGVYFAIGLANESELMQKKLVCCECYAQQCISCGYRN